MGDIGVGEAELWDHGGYRARRCHRCDPHTGVQGRLRTVEREIEARVREPAVVRLAPRCCSSCC